MYTSLPFFLVLLSFIISLLLVIAASAWFTRRLEAICDLLGLPIGVLSMLGALGANIPNYAASIVAIAGGHQDVGLGIIIGSNIYNVAIILGVSTLATSEGSGIILRLKEVQDVRIVGGYALVIVLTIMLGMWLLPGTPLEIGLHGTTFGSLLVIAATILALAIFGALVLHVFKRPHPGHTYPPDRVPQESPPGQPQGLHTVPQTASPPYSSALAPTLPPLSNARPYKRSLLRWIGEALLALLIALGGVVVLVQSGQELTLALHMPQVLAGLLVLAVATSLPNTVVAVSLVRTGRAAACVEEVFSSNSINAALGIALPLLIWHQLLNDHLLLILDAPLMVVLTLGALLAVLTGRLQRQLGVLLLLVYAIWVIVHVWL